MDFWPVPYLGNNKVTKFKKKVRYSDGKWLYEGDTEKGIVIKVTCECGKKHAITLGPGMHCEIPNLEEILDAEEVKDEG